jgi:Mrp family chromosome partitioning ATPase/predicted Fe-Mo cluster-binding NifX family protein
MSEACTHQCGSCGQDCASRDLHEPCNPYSNIKHVIGVVSGKGGVGKSSVTASLAVAMRRKGYRVGVLDADITGPSIPKLFGLHGTAQADERGVLATETRTGIKIMSLNLLTANETDPVIWRGPVIAGTVKQFWTDVVWGDVDYLFVDMPPGTGDVPLTVFQTLPVDGIIVVTSPQDLVSMIVTKAVKMAQMMNIPVLGLIENYSYFQCPDCGKKHQIFGISHLDETAEQNGVSVLGTLPIDPELAAACDKGEIECFDGYAFDEPAALIERKVNRASRQVVAVALENGQVCQHFGRTPQFQLYTVENGKVVNSTILSSGGTGHEALSGLLAQNHVDAVICGGIGGGAINALSAQGIQVIPGASGSPETCVNKLLAGEQVGDPSVLCGHHDQGDNHCGQGGSCCH